jgi:N-acetylneuraminic acid mutarotase
MKALFTCIFLLFSFFLSAQIDQNSQWVWMKGDASANAFGVYGTQGTPTAANKPGARENAVTWKDRSGNFWLFGGLGYASAGSGVGYLNDLWKYDPTTNQWTWVKGDNFANNLGAYGPKGASDPAYKPAARRGAIGWTDLFGNLWLFGGHTVVDITEAYLNDLWEFDTFSNQWTFVSGDNTINSQGVYGTKGTSAPGNKPSGRELSVAWGDGFNLWLFGGEGIGFGGNNADGKVLNDLWKYDTFLNEWTWISGANFLQGRGVYGTQGTGASANTPGARSAAVSWKDLSGKMWLFGGVGNGTTSTQGFLNDLWKYDGLINQWTWVKGDSIINSKGVYGTTGTTALPNKPGARNFSTAGIEPSGTFLLYGGLGFPASGVLSNLNDLWRYNPSTNVWTWLKGDSTANTTAGVYGTQGTASSSNRPGGRNSSVSWTDATGNFWLFGGYGYASVGTNTYLNDLWKLGSNTELPVTYTTTNATCSNGSVVISWQTAQELNSQKYEIEKSTGNSWIVIGTVNATRNSNSLSNYTFTDFSPRTDELYRIAEIDKDGRKMYSQILRSSCSQIQRLEIWPNPATTNVTIQSASLINRIQLFNAAGMLLEDVTPHKNNYDLKLFRFSPGSYFLRIEIGHQIINRKFIIN